MLFTYLSNHGPNSPHHRPYIDKLYESVIRLLYIDLQDLPKLLEPVVDLARDHLRHKVVVFIIRICTMSTLLGIKQVFFIL